MYFENLVFIRNEWTTDVWTPMYMCGQGLENSVVGIVGCGRIGTSVAKKVKAFNIKRLLYYNRKEKQEGEILNFFNRIFSI